MSAFRKSHYLFLYLIIHQTACKMNYTCPCWGTLPRTNQSLIPLLAFLSCFSSPSFPSHLSPRSLFVGTASGCSAGTARAAAWHERNQWHTTPPLLLVLREDLKTGMWGRKVGGERFSQTSARPRSGASGADTKNKVAAVCFLYSALPLLLFFASAAVLLFSNSRQWQHHQREYAQRVFWEILEFHEGCLIRQSSAAAAADISVEYCVREEDLI